MTNIKRDEHGPENDERELDSAVARAKDDIAEAIKSRLPEGTVEPRELAKVIAEIVSLEIQQVVYSYRGPMPHPAMLKEYEDALPGLAERIAARAEKEQEFRHELARNEFLLAKERQLALLNRAILGQVLAFIIALTAIGGGIILLAMDKGVVGLGAIIAALVALVTVFIAGKVAEFRSKEAEAARNETSQ